MDIAAQLRELAANLYWTWDPNTIAVFRDIDPGLWRKVNHNPVAFLQQLPAKELHERAADLALETRISFAFHRLRDYLERRQSWGDIYAGPLKANPVAYFSAEFGLHESIPIYAGGFGTLAGDHLKSASDLGVPVVGVGLLYAQGYFNQALDKSGWQQEHYFQTKTDLLPLERVHVDGKPLRVQVETRAATIHVAVWRAHVGRSLLVLLDSDTDGNSEWHRQITGRLYGGDSALRITQELILGVGGMRALAALGVGPAVLHLNEGHSAFATLEAARQEMVSDGIPFAVALRRVRNRAVFTTHTPVEAGHDRFEPALVEQTFGVLRERLHLSPEDFFALGRVNPHDVNEWFCLTVLGLKTAGRANAVSAHHGNVTRRMWSTLWPGRPESEIPISHVTNGVHTATWLAPHMRQLYDRCLGADWPARATDPATWNGVDDMEDAELWETHQILKARLVSYVQRQVCAQEAVRVGNQEICDVLKKRLNPDVLTIGFAKRFATYKRGDLVLADDKRLERLVSDPDRPVQILFAGKAHPRDEPGKRLVQRIFHMTRDPRFQGRIVFLEDYDINVARHLVQGVDVWLNAPRRPFEACGTSGMKAVFNGVLNLSILDGWWAEAYDGVNGFAVGRGGEHANPEEQDRRDAEALYTALEREVLPLYYARDALGVPREWMVRVKNALRSLAWRFNADRMVAEYARTCYFPMVGAGEETGRP